jgi:hypothetical protein
MVDTVQPGTLAKFRKPIGVVAPQKAMLKGEEVRSVPPQNVSPSAQGLEVKEILSSSGRERSGSLDIPLYRTGDVGANPESGACHRDYLRNVFNTVIGNCLWRSRLKSAAS